MKQKTTKQLVEDLTVTVQKLSANVKNLSVYTVKGFGDVNERINELEDKMATKKGMDKVYNLADQAVKELKDMRIEQSAHRQEHDDVDERLDKIEAIPVVAHELKKNSR